MFTVLQEVTSGGLVLHAATICCSCAAAVLSTERFGEGALYELGGLVSLPALSAEL